MTTSSHARARVGLIVGASLSAAALLLGVAGDSRAERSHRRPLSATTGAPLIDPIELSDEERAWLRGHPRVRAHYEPWPPFMVDEGGRPGGITVDYVELIFGELGLEVEWVRTDWVDALHRVREGGDIDLLPILTHNEEREEFLLFTQEYVSYPIVIFTRRDSFFTSGVGDLEGRIVAVERDYAMHHRLVRQLPDSPLLVVSTTQEALEAVATARADAYVGNLAVGSYVIEDRGLTNLKVAAPSPYGTHDQAMGVRRDWPILAELLDRGLDAVRPAGHNEIRQRWLAVRYEHGIRPRDVLRWALIISALVLVVVLVIVVWNRRLNREVGVRRRAEAALEQSRSQLLEAEHLAGIGSWSCARGSEDLAWSPESFRIFGRDPALGPPTFEELRESVAEEDRGAFDEVVAAARDADRACEVEVRIRRPDGSLRHVICRGGPSAEEGHGEPRGSIGTFHDVTEIAEAESEREQLEAQVRHAQKLESLGVLAGGIAHDFNNILAAILGNAELALEEVPPEGEAAMSLEEVITSSKRAGDLCQQMLAYSGRGYFLMGNVDLSATVREMVRLLSVSISKKAELRLDLGEGQPAIEADQTQVSQVVMNLITNASEALEGESGSITVATRVVDRDDESFEGATLADGAAPGTYVALEVTDTGRGMDAATRSRLFDPFFTTKFAGRGLGMAAVLGIVRSHGGAIRVDSRPDLGSKLTVFWPVAETVERRRISRPPSPSGVVRSTGLVLVVDDEPQLRSAAERMLKRGGFAVVTARNGREALEIFRARKEDIGCVLLDLTMPELDGVETLAGLRQLDPEVPVVVVSGYHESEVEERFGGGERPDDFLQKPFELGALVSAIGAAMRRAA